MKAVVARGMGALEVAEVPLPSIGGGELLVRLVTAKRIDLKRLISHSFPIDQAQEAFEVARKGQGLKVMIRPNA